MVIQMSSDLSSPSSAYRLMKIVATVLLAGLLGTIIYYSNLHEQLFQRKERELVAKAGPISARPLAMDFEFIDARTGLKQRLSDLRGKVVHINFWASWCLPCQEELPFLASLQKEHAANLTVLLVNLDTSAEGLAAGREMQTRLAPDLMSIYDNTAELKVLFNIEALPFHYIVDKAGRSASAFYARLDKEEEKIKELLLQLVGEPAPAPN
jgi:thiol-disulfide isomerase/thioredoxin